MKAVTVPPFLAGATGCAGYLRAAWLRAAWLRAAWLGHREHA